MTDQFLSVLDGRDSSESAALTRASDRPRILHRPGAVRSSTRPFVKNGILAGISLQELAAIGEYFEPVVLRERMILQEPKKQLEHIYFIESGLVSLRIVAAGSMLETAVIGHRGAVGASLLAGGHLATRQSVVLVAGSAHRILAEDLRRVLPGCSEVREHLVRFAQAQNLHCAQTGFCGVRHDREKRLACWLCLASDALDADVLPITHDYLSSMLGLRRPGVTETLIRFEQQGLIRKARGVLQIKDRHSLEQKACSCYRLIASAYFATASGPSATDDTYSSFESHISSF
ncbi:MULTISPECIES: Crp/Fnr family transcriptional regulator [unclassified Bradyrhizobium]|uniref:Crp/Fnr family transcriptional regulator n=1 Tax=unclassified Bradyrhizobium TaxID=2631580 RepID=UPI001FF7E26B|nr:MULTISPECIES: Crp/Fnr family transcriptional regulator [unclassified Bradyrhizobium]MCK1538474.1 Crp/Fnr family transcriptional regulator [Bradyrhizobium sp. 176]MCK1554824.1 Crp/Fnr family transcriptional regulator [Bradyrhizobium sp. 171]